jgi:hypothetical protein
MNGINGPSTPGFAEIVVKSKRSSKILCNILIRMSLRTAPACTGKSQYRRKFIGSSTSEVSPKEQGYKLESTLIQPHPRAEFFYLYKTKIRGHT